MAKLGQYDITKMTAQEVADAVALHLFEQSEKSVDGDEDCVYNGDGVCCAAAPFTPEYDETMERNDWLTLLDMGMVPSNHKNLIRLLQNIHDIDGIHQWKDGLYQLYLAEDIDPSLLNEWEYNGETGRYEKV